MIEDPEIKSKCIESEVELDNTLIFLEKVCSVETTNCIQESQEAIQVVTDNSMNEQLIEQSIVCNDVVADTSLVIDTSSVFPTCKCDGDVEDTRLTDLLKEDDS